MPAVRKKHRVSEVLKEIGPAIQFARKKRGLTRHEVSRLTRNRLDPSYLGRIERMEQDPSLQTIDVLLKAFDLSLHQLLLPYSLQKSSGKNAEINLKRSPLIKKLPFMRPKDIKVLDNFAKLLLFWKSNSAARQIISYYDKAFDSDKRT